jgi:hypothetical protein
MDALKDIPDHADRLETEKGIAKLQKTDIFKKLMWFSYANAEEWIPLQIDRVKYVQQLNKKGIKPPDLKEEVLEVNKTPIAKAPDYENVVGQDSLTRLDDKTPRKRASQKRNKKPKNASTAPALASPHPVQTIVKSPESKQAEVASTDDIPSRNRNNNRRKHRSNKNRPKPTV